MLLILSQEHKEHLRLLSDMQVEGMSADKVIFRIYLPFVVTVLCVYDSM